MTGISLLFYPVVSLVHYVRHIALATVSSSRHDIILARRSVWCSYYCFFYYCFSYCFVVIAFVINMINDGHSLPGYTAPLALINCERWR
jgi:hypothetical protein